MIDLFVRSTGLTVRVHLPEVLAELGDPRAVPALTDALGDALMPRGWYGDRKVYPVRDAARRALARITATG